MKASQISVSWLVMSTSKGLFRTVEAEHKMFNVFLDMTIVCYPNTDYRGACDRYVKRRTRGDLKVLQYNVDHTRKYECHNNVECPE